MKKINYFLLTTLFVSLFNFLLTRISIPILGTGFLFFHSTNVSAQDVFYFLDIGNKNYNNGLYFDAINNFKKVLLLENKSKNAENAYYKIALSYLKIDDYLNALENSNELIKLNSYYPNAFFLRGSVYEELNQYQDAVDDFNIALKKISTNDPFKAKIYFVLGNNKINLRDFEGAKSDFTKAIKIEPNWHKLYKNRARAKGLLGEMESGILDLNRAIDLKKDYASAYYVRAMFFRMLKKYKKACDDYEQANYYGDKRGLKEFNEMYCFDFVD